MFCRNCGAQIDDAAAVCPNCGVATNANPAPYYGGAAPAPAQSNGLAIAGFVLSLLGFNVIALILSAVGLAQSKKLNGNGKGLAIAGIVISSISVVGFIILLIVLVGGAAAAASTFAAVGLLA